MEANAPGDAAQTAAQPKKGKLQRYIRKFNEKCCYNRLNQQEPDRAPTVYISKFNSQVPNSKPFRLVDYLRLAAMFKRRQITEGICIKRWQACNV